MTSMQTFLLFFLFLVIFFALSPLPALSLSLSLCPSLDRIFSESVSYRPFIGTRQINKPNYSNIIWADFFVGFVFIVRINRKSACHGSFPQSAHLSGCLCDGVFVCKLAMLDINERTNLVFLFLISLVVLLLLLLLSTLFSFSILIAAATVAIATADRARIELVVAFYHFRLYSLCIIYNAFEFLLTIVILIFGLNTHTHTKSHMKSMDD